MCGIFGSEVYWEVFPSLVDMSYRGPDALREVHYGDFCLGLARLAIVSTSDPRATQPHVTRKGNVVAFNGEIYNYQALDSRKGVTEVSLLGEMIDSGGDPRRYVDGDYAIAHFNPSVGRLTLYRDRFGVCPLYYQVRPVVEISSERRRLRPRAREVPANGKVVIDVRKRRVVERNVMPVYGASVQPIESAAALVEHLLNAVRSRALHSDSGFSLALSGGLDSSLLAALLFEAKLMPFECLSVGFGLSDEDLALARLVADGYGFPLQQHIIYEDEIRARAREVREHLEDEWSDGLRLRGAIRMWCVARMSSTRVILCGDGADELLGGYPSHYAVAAKHPQWQVSEKRLSTLRSMQHFNLDRTNKMGMAHSKEFRPPYLASTLSQVLLSLPQGKDSLREVAGYLGVPRAVMARGKYSAAELAFNLRKEPA